jgi:cytoskeletal protein CcmA (bactofilin family)
MVTVHKRGSLEGDVTARAITVEKGGTFSGQLVIGDISITQGELLQGQEPVAARIPESNFPDVAPRPLPAT